MNLLFVSVNYQANTPKYPHSNSIRYIKTNKCKKNTQPPGGVMCYSLFEYISIVLEYVCFNFQADAS